MNYDLGLPTTVSGNDRIWVVVDRLTESPISSWFSKVYIGKVSQALYQPDCVIAWIPSFYSL
uniref:Retrotransposon protein n=1 Tax=Solanum tuberosum TaxID=4113 RepID=M1CJ15_SOLTU